jgi:ABC-type lipoprotein release transport system permease subunit
MIGTALLWAAAGTIAGAAAALLVTRYLQTLLFDVSPTDPVTFAAMVLLLLGVAALAAWLPARRAARLNPLSALREG